MIRYIKTLRVFWVASISAELEYRINFVVAVLVSVGGLAGSIFALTLFYQGRDDLGGWSMDEALMVVAMFTLLEGVSESFLAPNLSRIVQYVQQGTLDFVLLKPIDAQFWLSTRNLAPWGLPNMLFAVGLFIYAAVRCDLSAGAYVFAVVPVTLAVLVLYSIWFMLGATSIWFVKIYNVTHVLRSFMEAGRFPMSAYPLVYQFVLTFIVPVAFMTTVPAKVMLGRGEAPWQWVAAAAALAAGLLVASRLFWRFARRYYTSASS